MIGSSGRLMALSVMLSVAPQAALAQIVGRPVSAPIARFGVIAARLTDAALPGLAPLAAAALSHSGVPTPVLAPAQTPTAITPLRTLDIAESAIDVATAETADKVPAANMPATQVSADSISFDGAPERPALAAPVSEAMPASRPGVLTPSSFGTASRMGPTLSTNYRRVPSLVFSRQAGSADGGTLLKIFVLSLVGGTVAGAWLWLGPIEAALVLGITVLVFLADLFKKKSP